MKSRKFSISMVGTLLVVGAGTSVGIAQIGPILPPVGPSIVMQPRLIPDVNGDGVDDFTTSAPFEQSMNGRVRIYSGADFSMIRVLEPDPPAGTQGFGSDVRPWSGNTTHAESLLIGAVYATVGAHANAGLVYVIDPVTGDVEHSFDSPNATGNSLFGNSLVTGHDLNSDGVDDIIVSAPGENRVYVFSGDDFSLLQTIEGPVGASSFGSTLQWSTDFNDDSIPDIFVGSMLDTVGGQTNAGRVYLYSGADFSLIHTFESPNPTEDSFFSQTFLVSDVTGGGTRDIVIPSIEQISGELYARAYLFSGETFSLVHTLEADPAGLTGTTLAAVGIHGVSDITGDGTNDILMGVASADAIGVGNLQLFSGVDGSHIRSHELPSPLNATNGSGQVVPLKDYAGDGSLDFATLAVGQSSYIYFYTSSPSINVQASSSFREISPDSTIPSSLSHSITNNGIVDVELGDPMVTFTGDHAADFDYNTFSPVDILEPGESLSTFIYFVPTAEGTHEATLNIHSNSPLSPFQVDLTAVARAIVPPSADGVVYIAIEENIFAIDLSSGDRQVIVSSTYGVGQNMFTGDGAIGLVNGNTDLYRADRNGGQGQLVDLSTGNRPPFIAITSSTIQGYIGFRDLIAINNDEFYSALSNFGVGQLDWLNGEHTTVSADWFGQVEVGDGLPFADPVAIAREDADTLLVADRHANSIYRVDISTGDRTSNSLSPSFTPTSMGLLPDGELAIGTTGTNVYRVDPATGNASVLSSNSVGSGDPIEDARLVRVSNEGNLFLYDLVSETLFQIDPDTGNRTTISSTNNAHPVGDGPAIAPQSTIDFNTHASMLIHEGELTSVRDWMLVD